MLWEGFERNIFLMCKFYDSRDFWGFGWLRNFYWFLNKVGNEFLIAVDFILNDGKVALKCYMIDECVSALYIYKKKIPL